MTTIGSAEVATLWALATDGIMFTLSWRDVEARCREETDPDCVVTATQRLVPVEYAKWRLDGLDAIAAVVRTRLSTLPHALLS